MIKINMCVYIPADCSRGSYWTGVGCELCPPNMYQPLPNKETCIPCDVGLGTEFGLTGAVLKTQCKGINVDYL